MAQVASPILGRKVSVTNYAEDQQAVHVTVEVAAALDKKPREILEVGWPSPLEIIF